MLICLVGTIACALAPSIGALIVARVVQALGSAGGLIAYFAIGWYVAALIGTGISFLVTIACAAWGSSSFSWKDLGECAGEGAR